MQDSPETPTNQMIGSDIWAQRILQLLAPPCMQPREELDRFLPYAIALELKAAWGDHLSQTFFASTVVAEG